MGWAPPSEPRRGRLARLFGALHGFDVNALPVKPPVPWWRRRRRRGRGSWTGARAQSTGDGRGSAAATAARAHLADAGAQPTSPSVLRVARLAQDSAVASLAAQRLLGGVRRRQGRVGDHTWASLEVAGTVRWARQLPVRGPGARSERARAVAAQAGATVLRNLDAGTGPGRRSGWKTGGPEAPEAVGAMPTRRGRGSEGSATGPAARGVARRQRVLGDAERAVASSGELVDARVSPSRTFVVGAARRAASSGQPVVGLPSGLVGRHTPSHAVGAPMPDGAVSRRAVVVSRVGRHAPSHAVGAPTPGGAGSRPAVALSHLGRHAPSHAVGAHTPGGAVSRRDVLPSGAARGAHRHRADVPWSVGRDPAWHVVGAPASGAVGHAAALSSAGDVDHGTRLRIHSAPWRPVERTGAAARRASRSHRASSTTMPTSSPFRAHPATAGTMASSVPPGQGNVVPTPATLRTHRRRATELGEEGEVAVSARATGWSGIDAVEWERHLRRVRPVTVSLPRRSQAEAQNPVAAVLSRLADPSAAAAPTATTTPPQKPDAEAPAAPQSTTTSPATGSTVTATKLVRDRRFVDDIVAALEARVLTELERRGGRFKERR